mmetsp:Transcript_7525/g.19071  ORF Transcript_7525/g.19071 Transcript_7525/m.19071 type:complete len:326 (-) Transcript_7525:207-1184(-)
MVVGGSYVAAQREKAEASRRVRADYRQLRKDTTDGAADLNGLDSTRMLCDKIKTANALLERVEKPREQAVDSELFLEFTKIGSSMASRLASGAAAAVTPMEFIKRLRRRFTLSDVVQAEAVEEEPHLFQWDDLGAAVGGLFSCVPGAATMLGPLDARPKERRVAERQRRRPLREVVNPDKMSEVELEEEKQNTDHNMEEMWKLLHRERPTPVLHLIMNHDSFAQTVENLFSLSFLVKDAKVGLQRSAELGICAIKRRAPDQADFEAKRAENMQFIIGLDMETWRELCTHVTPEQCLMRHRNDGYHAQQRHKQEQLERPAKAARVH